MTPVEPIGGRSPAGGAPAATRCAPLLDLDRDLGRALTPEQRALARRHLLVRVVRMRPGPWPMDSPGPAATAHLGLLVLDGLLGRELLADDIASLELLGSGDLIRPWEDRHEAELLRARPRWSALATTRFAVLDATVAARLAAYPAIYAELLERCITRTRRLAVTQAICQFNRVDHRLLGMLWHLAERWGKVTPEGIAIPLALSHRLLAQLIGARRPSVSTALASLVRSGALARAANGTWILTGSPDALDLRTSRHVSPRRPVAADGLAS
jgi:CRP/FNR family cyclic AMP-dependent transcriptional regulator